MQNQFIAYLQDELNVSSEQIQLALRQCEMFPSQLPMILWQYGLINLGQLDQIIDWWEMN
ncbi:conserved hypothetical protein [Gloeothece citriformis PCC 7424]|uniref:DUF2949 domain-containing protein n=1 Tax=Gloeothece citriformis (strain PCC 7424) TaxID=65393 RepID=B7KIK5_GLOC7|nr:DUF2949 domain-containing protein [Gloeothece citriformis]ACK69411.1 conserved hypothetical protein [Gloeothece citriformis PCC 7424]